MVAVGWIGAVLAYVALATAAEVSESVETVRASWITMELIGWYVIVPLAVATMISGLVMALGTRWGVFRHYWVVFSLVLTSVAAGVLLLHMPTVSAQADLARQDGASHVERLGGDVAHPSIGLVILLAVLVLNVYKPKGLTRYGQRKHAEEQCSTG